MRERLCHHFTRGAHPIELREEFRRFDIDIATESYDPPPVPLLALTARSVNPPDAPAYLSNWAAHFDYLYLVGPRIPNPLPELLERRPVASGSRFIRSRSKAVRPACERRAVASKGGRSDYKNSTRALNV